MSADNLDPLLRLKIAENEVRRLLEVLRRMAEGPKFPEEVTPRSYSYGDSWERRQQAEAQRRTSLRSSGPVSIELKDFDRREVGTFANDYANKMEFPPGGEDRRNALVGKLGEKALERFLELNNKVDVLKKQRWQVWLGRKLGDDGDFKTKHEERVDAKTTQKSYTRINRREFEGQRMAFYVAVRLSEDDRSAHLVGYLPYKKIEELTKSCPAFRHTGPDYDYWGIPHSCFWPINYFLDQFEDAGAANDSPRPAPPTPTPPPPTPTPTPPPPTPPPPTPPPTPPPPTPPAWRIIVLLAIVVAIVGLIFLNRSRLGFDNFEVPERVRLPELEFLADYADDSYDLISDSATDIYAFLSAMLTPTTPPATATPTRLPATLTPTTVPATLTPTTVPATPTIPPATPTPTTWRVTLTPTTVPATLTPTTPPATRTPTTPPASTPNLPYDPDGPDRNCTDFDTWQQAQDFYLAAGGPESDRHRLDGNRDGIACEGLPGAP